MDIKKILSLVFVGALVGSIALLLVIKSYFEIVKNSEEEEDDKETQEVSTSTSLPQTKKEVNASSESKKESSPKEETASPPHPKKETPSSNSSPSANDVEPLSAAAREKWPHIDIIGPQDTKVSLSIHFDNQKVCTLDGTIDPSAHRPFQGGFFIVDGACQSPKLITRGVHEYKLFGKIKMPDGSEHDVSFTTGQQDISNVIEPSIDIDAQGKVSVRLAVW